TSYTSKGSRRPAASYFGMSTDVPSSGFTTGGGTGDGLAAATRAGIGATAIGTGGGGDVHAPRTSARPIGVSVWGRGSLIGALIAPLPLWAGAVSPRADTCMSREPARP